MYLKYIQSTHGKDYPAAEEGARKANFLAVDAQIQAHNNNPKKTFVMAHNHLSDLVSFRPFIEFSII